MRIVLLASTISIVLGNIDYWRLESKRSPIFVFTWMEFFDGGTFVGDGFGYSLIANHGAMYAMEHGGKHTVEEITYTEGPELRFWFFPFLNRKELKFREIKMHR